MERVPLMVTFHLTCEYRLQTNKQKILFTYFKYVNKPKYSDLSTGLQLPCKLAKKCYSRQGKIIVLKIMKMCQHNSTEADL